MAQEQIIFSTYCEDHLQERFGTHKLINSFKYFHPDYEIILYGTEDIKKIHKEHSVTYSNALPCIMLDIKRKYGTEFVCHIDSDSLCLGRFDEILELDYEIASVRNNCDAHAGDERTNRPQCIWNVPNEKYVSCGCISTNSEEFLLNWRAFNYQIIKDYGGVKAFWMCDQNWMNHLFHNYYYKTKILDLKERNVFYGASANMYSKGKRDPEHIIKEWNINGWQSWQDIEYKDNKFWMYNKEVKLLHQCGGGSPETAIKLSFNMFNPEIISILKEITKCDE